MPILNTDILVTKEGDELFPNEFDNARHCITAITTCTGLIKGCLAFSSLFMLYQFGLVLVQKAVYDSNFFLELACTNENEIIDGMCFCNESERFFLSCESSGEEPNLPFKFTLPENLSNILSNLDLQNLRKNIQIQIAYCANNTGMSISFLSEATMYQFGILLLWCATYQRNYRTEWLEIYKTRIYFYHVTQQS